MKRCSALVVLLAAACATPSGPGGVVPGEASPSSLAAGRRVFLELSEPRCGACHALTDAGSTGTLGPDLDAMRPDAPSVIAAVTGGVGVMRAQGHLTEQQVQALADYVSRVAGQLN